MKVKELIAELKKWSKDAEVQVFVVDEDMTCEITEVGKSTIPDEVIFLESNYMLHYKP